ncbi:MAG: amidohydrolase family protein [Burkholderiales bacterium]|nr:amidohydrolase family protein [Burkholderiales bacterium]
MNYTQGQAICDADSHLMETPDWLAGYADRRIRDRLKPLNLAKAGSSTLAHIQRQVERVKDPVQTAALRDNVVAGPKGWAAYGAFDAGERRQALDDLGFTRQLVFSTFAAGQYLAHEDMDVRYGGARAHNRGIAEFCQGDDRLIAVGQVSLADPQRAAEEIREGIRMGCGAFWVPHSPEGERSPGHPEVDVVWRTLAEAQVPFMLHVGPAASILPKGYENNGHPRPPDIHGGGENLRFRELVALAMSPQLYLSAMVSDGVFERFPTLRGGVIELGAGWVPQFLRSLDIAYRIFVKTDPQLKALSMPPSDYLRRQVKFTPFPSEDVGRMVADAGPELFLFSSDYPHPEGTDDPIGRFERSMTQLPDAAKRQFYAQNFEAMMRTA